MQDLEEFLATPILLIAISAIYVLLAIYHIVDYIRQHELIKQSSPKAASPELLLGRLVGCLVGGFLALTMVFLSYTVSKENVKWKHLITQKASHYTIYVNGIEVENKDINITNYPKYSVDVDDNERVIRISR